MMLATLFLTAALAPSAQPATPDDRCPSLTGIYLCDGGEGQPSGIRVEQGEDDTGPWIRFGDDAPQVRLNDRGYFDAEDGTRIPYQAVCRDAARIALEIGSTPISPATSLVVRATTTGYRVDAEEAGVTSTETCIRHRGHGLGTGGGS